MAVDSAIEWTDATFNPWRGCEKVSPGCKFCYAEALAKRNPAVLGTWGPDGARPVGSEAYWRQPVAWNREAAAEGRRRRVFCASLSDVFEDRSDLDAHRGRLFELIEATPSLDWLLVTKRIDNPMGREPKDLVPDRWRQGWPGNVWLGATTENASTYNDRVRKLCDTPAAVVFCSVEPLLGPIGPLRLDVHRVDWLIVGGESGGGARDFRPEWARAIREEALEHGRAFFMKQMGSRWQGSVAGDLKGGDLESIPEDLRIRQFPR